MTRAQALLRWYRRRHRDIPWRGERDPYRILVGEVMAQQTQAVRAARHYRRFIRRYPSAASLAEAPLADVLREWAGLGYNSRAKRLREAAAKVAAGGWPDDLEELPGVGPYTASAVACFAFGEHRAVVDTNVKRVLGRWRGEVLGGDGQAEAEAQLQSPAAEWNQAVMDLGAEVCTARNPSCEACPVSTWCPGPDAYQPPPRQSRYEGSLRQARSAVLLHLAARGPRSIPDLTEQFGERTDAALEALSRDGMVAISGGVVSIAEG